MSDIHPIKLTFIIIQNKGFVKVNVLILEGQNMETTTNELLDVLKIFSEIFNIPPPKSNDIGLWWHQVIRGMEIELLYLLYDNNVLGRCDNEVLIFMNNLLINRITEIEILVN